MLFHLLSASLGDPVLCFKKRPLGLKSFLHSRRDQRRKKTQQTSSYFNYAYLRQDNIQKNLKYLHSFFDSFLVDPGKLLVEVLSNNLEEGVGVHIDHMPFLVLHKLFEISEATLQKLTAIFFH